MFDDRGRLRKFPRLFFRVDFLPVHNDFEDPATRRNQFQRSNILFEPQKFFRQTDGLRLIISHAAIFDRNLESHKAER